MNIKTSIYYLEMANKQIYSATYSNVPVFEFVTSEGPIMRRKNDSWINATHILKVAKFPKAKRTRILEKDVQSGVHEKVQGGYGKYQGTYVPLDLGAELAKSFGVYEELKPIFEFQYVEGKSSTPPPAPKHNHASASNIAQRMHFANAHGIIARKTKSTNSISEPPKKRGRPKRVNLPNEQAPNLNYNDTAPINTVTATRQNTQPDMVVNTRSVNNDDLEVVDSSDNDDIGNDEVDFISGKELFGTPRNSFERIVNRTPYYNNQSSMNGTFNGLPVSHSRNPSQLDAYGLSQYHHPQQNIQLQSFKDEGVYAEYFNNLLSFFLDDTNNQDTEPDKKEAPIPKTLLNPPQPILKININQPIDNDGNTVFHWACSMGNYTAIEFLTNNFANIIHANLKNNNGETPLMFLIRFTNSYQLKNFPMILDLLVDSILAVDNHNKTVLHHIALMVLPPSNLHHESFINDETHLRNYLNNKERVGRYYVECLFNKIVEYQTINNIKNDEVIRKFINHQDNDGNTAFHLISYNLNKKLIKVFINYHKFINFHLKNLVNYTVEQYLASHNYILKLEHDEKPDPTQREAANSISSSTSSVNETVKPVVLNELTKSFTIQSFESQLYYSKMTVNLTNSKTNTLTEKLTELQFLIDKELNEKDETLLKLLNINNQFNNFKIIEQKTILKIFKLDNLIQDISDEFETFHIDLKRDKIIQDEINRFLNDLVFQVLQKKEKLDHKLSEYQLQIRKLCNMQLHNLTNSKVKSDDVVDPDNKFQLAVELQSQIIRSQTLLNRVFELSPKVPYLNKEEFKENNPESVVANYPSDDKLNKYCKLISLCCGMNVNEVESSIDSIEASLIKSMK